MGSSGIAVDRLLDTQPLSILLYPNSKQLLQFRQTDQLVSLINRSFSEQSPEHMRGTRTDNIESFVRELGEGTFTIVLCSAPMDESETPVIYGVGSAHPYVENRAFTSENMNIWAYQTESSEDLTDVERWELKIMAIDTQVQRQGLGDYILNLLNSEIIRRFRANQRAGSGKMRCQTVHTTMYEVNNPWYAKRGYEARYMLPIAIGEFKSGGEGNTNFKPFHVISMAKYIV